MAEEKKLTLSVFMDKTRSILTFGVALLIAVTIFEFGRSIYAKLKPTPDATKTASLPSPDFVFGALPAIIFPAQTSANRPQSYELKIAGIDLKNSAGWPMFGIKTAAPYTMAEVYKLKPPTFSLTAEEKARQIAKNLNFESDPQILDSRTYLFSYPGPPFKEELQIDLKTMFTSLKTDYLAVSNVFGLITESGEKYLPDRTKAIAALKNYLAVAGILPTDLNDQKAEVKYAKNIDGKLELVENVLEADYLTVNLTRNPLPGLINGQPTTYSFYGPNNIASIYGVVGRDYNGVDIVGEMEYYHYNLDLSNKATYYLRSVAEAWQNLQLGEAYVINPRKIKNAVINQVEMGYYESHKEQEYLLPIYIFRGENDFLAYVPAIHPNMLAR